MAYQVRILHHIDAQLQLSHMHIRSGTSRSWEPWAVHDLPQDLASIVNLCSASLSTLLRVILVCCAPFLAG